MNCLKKDAYFVAHHKDSGNRRSGRGSEKAGIERAPLQDVKDRKGCIEGFSCLFLSFIVSIYLKKKKKKKKLYELQNIDVFRAKFPNASTKEMNLMLLNGFEALSGPEAAKLAQIAAASRREKDAQREALKSQVTQMGVVPLANATPSSPIVMDDARTSKSPAAAVVKASTPAAVAKARSDSAATKIYSSSPAPTPAAKSQGPPPPPAAAAKTPGLDRVLSTGHVVTSPVENASPSRRVIKPGMRPKNSPISPNAIIIDLISDD